MSFHLRIDPILCDGRGTCADLLSEGIRLDDWGFAMVNSSAIPDALVSAAKKTCAMCPTGALRIEQR